MTNRLEDSRVATSRSCLYALTLLTLGCSGASETEDVATGGSRSSAGSTSANTFGGSTAIAPLAGQAVLAGRAGSPTVSQVSLGGSISNAGRSSGVATTSGQPNGGVASGGNAFGGTSTVGVGGRISTGGMAGVGAAAAGRNSSGGTTSATSTGVKPNGGASAAGRVGAGGGSGAGGTQAAAGSFGGQGIAGGPAEVRIVGRTAPGTKGGVRFQWSGVSIQARFRGTQISVQLEDGSNQNEFTVVVDDKVMSNLVTASGKTKYQLASGLANGDHQLVLWRRTEAYYNPTEYLGFTDFGTNGVLLPAAPAPERRIEIIGDSITCGYGNEGTPSCSGTKPENNYLAYGSVAARALGADLHTVAWSGIGMYRNYGESGPSADTMPTRYDSALPTVTGTTWDFSKFVPQVVVVNLGTNDFSTKGDPGQPYVDAYVKFVQHLRSVYPQAYLLCLIPVTEAAAALNSVVATIKTGGDTKIEAFDTNSSSGGHGCDGHPDVAKHAAMGAKLAAEIQRVMGW